MALASRSGLLYPQALGALYARGELLDDDVAHSTSLIGAAGTWPCCRRSARSFHLWARDRCQAFIGQVTESPARVGVGHVNAGKSSPRQADAFSVEARRSASVSNQNTQSHAPTLDRVNRVRTDTKMAEGFGE